MDDKLTIESLTGGEREGRGIFDKLMRSVKAQLDVELSSGNLTPHNYSAVYLGALQHTLGHGLDYLLRYRQANNDVLIGDEQILAAKANVQLVNAQISKLIAETSLTAKQEALVDEQILAAVQTTANLVKQGLLLDQQIANALKDLDSKDANIALVGEQTKLVTQQTSNALTENTTMIKQQLKMDSEIAVLNQKQVTEEAQTKDTVGGVAVGGVIGKQKELYANQAEGYIRDAEQKAAKLMLDSFITRVSTDYDNADAVNAGVGDVDCKAVINKLKLGVGA